MSHKIQIKRGLQANLPALDVGEIGFTTDQKRTYIGSAQGNIELAKASELADIAINIKSFGAKGDGVTDDTNAIQATVDAVAARGGGTVIVPEKTFIASTISLPSYVMLKGTGRKSVIKQKANTTGDLVKLKLDTSQMVQVRDLTLDGNKANQTAPNRGIAFENSRSAADVKNASLLKEHDCRHYVENVYIIDTKGDGMFVGGRGESQFRGIQILRPDGRGFYFESQDNWLEALSVGESGLQGFIMGVDDSNERLINCKAWFSGRIDVEQGDGFDFRGKRYALASCEAQDNSKHGFVFKGTDISGAGLVGDTNGWQYASGLIYPGATGFLFFGAKNCNIQGMASNRFGAMDPRQSYALQLLNGASGNSINLSSMYMGTSALIESQLNTQNQVNVQETKTDNTTVQRLKASSLSLNIENFGMPTPAYIRALQTLGHSVGPILRHDSDVVATDVLRLEKLDAAGNTANRSRWNFNINHSTKELKLTPIESGGAFTVESFLKVKDSTWDGKTFQMGNYRFWVDASGRLRMRNGVPTSDTDGTIVGTQT